MKFFIADRKSDQIIKKFLDKYPSEGTIHLGLKRPKGYFESTSSLGNNTFPLIVFDDRKNQMACMGVLSRKKVFLDNKSIKMGYLSDLRVDLEYRRKIHMAFGYKKMRELIQEKNVDYCYTTIMKDNFQAIKTLESKKAGLPNYHYITDFHTMAINGKFNFFKNISENLEWNIRTANINDLPAIINFFKEQSKNKAFFPNYSVNDFKEEKILKDLKLDDIVLAIKNNKIIGVTALWDQSKYRYWSIDHYGHKVKLFKLFYNLYAKIKHAPLFPEKKAFLKYKLISLIAIKDDNLNIFKSLLAFIWEKSRSDQLDFILTGLCKDDPLIKIFSHIPKYEMLSNLYLVSWDQLDIKKIIKNHTPYIELGSL